MALAPTPMMQWGELLGNTWTFPSAVDNPVATPEQKIGFAESDALYRDAWVGATHAKLSFEVRFIPSSTQGSVTGYNADGGVQEALLYMQANGGRYFPDKSDTGTYHDVYLLEYSVERDGSAAYYRVKMTLRDAGGNLFRSI